MKRLVPILACLLALLVGAWQVPGQQPRLDDTPFIASAADEYKQLPLGEAAKARVYTRAELLLAGEIERNPKSQVLLHRAGDRAAGGADRATAG